MRDMKGGFTRLDGLFDRLSSSNDGRVSLSYFKMQLGSFLSSQNVGMDRQLHKLFASFDLTNCGQVDMRDMQCAFRYGHVVV